MIDLENETNFVLDTEILEQICKNIYPQNIELIFVKNERMREINLNSRGIDKATDVLSFPYEPLPNSPFGSIVINLDLANKVANSLHHSLQEEVCILFIHGLLHIMGLDHEKDNGEMRIKEKEIAEFFGLPTNLIQRQEL